MINEFHTCLVYRPTPSQEIVGEDYQVPGLQFPKLGPSAAAVRRAILVRPERPESANWRAAELRRAIQQSDLNNLLLTKFDQRTGYLLRELTEDLVSMFRPHLYGGPRPGDVRVAGKYRSQEYRLDTWTLKVDPSAWSIESPYYANAAGSISGEDIVTAKLPGHDGHVRFPTDSPGTYWISWASRPTYSLADTAEELRTSVKPAIVNLAQDSSSRFSADERHLLRDIAVGGGEDVAQVCAAALLFAGHAADHVSRSNRVSAETANL